MNGTCKRALVISLCGILLAVPGCGDPPAGDLADAGADSIGPLDAADAPDGDPEALDILDRLLAIEGMLVVEERSTDRPGYRFFVMRYEQPSDHEVPDGQTFAQLLTLLHRDCDAPTVLATTGYSNYFGDGLTEPAWLLEANQIGVEHRFFSGSRPDPANWDHLRIRQAAADHHRIVEALRPIYRGAWLSTGASKGGMTSIYHRRFYPDDVDGTVAYVAPISFGAPDDRYLAFFDTVGPADCRQDIKDYQRDLLENRREYIEQEARADALIEDWTFSFLGGLEEAVEAAVIELEWSFWQYLSVGECSWVPGPEASDAAAYGFLQQVSDVGAFSDERLIYYLPYYFQADVELGYPGFSAPPHLADLLLYPDSSWDAMFPAGFDRTYDPSAMVDIADWVATEGSELLLVYGENDPWTAGAFDLGDATDSYKLTVPEGNHNVGIAQLPQPARGQALAALETWAGVSIDRTAVRAERSVRRTPPILPR